MLKKKEPLNKSASFLSLYFHIPGVVVACELSLLSVQKFRNRKLFDIAYLHLVPLQLLLCKGPIPKYEQLGVKIHCLF